MLPIELPVVSYISQERTLKLDFHGEFSLLPYENNLLVFESSKFKGLRAHPDNREAISDMTFAYIKSQNDCYDLTKDMLLSPSLLDDIFTWYDDSRNGNSTMESLANNIDPQVRQTFNIVKYYLTPLDFQSHFKWFNPEDSNADKYERDLANKSLSNKKVGTWLIRYSSLNRSLDPSTLLINEHNGIKFYVLSYIQSVIPLKSEVVITHLLLKQRVGFGWHYSNMWFPTFLECIEYTLSHNNLTYSERISTYINVDDIKHIKPAQITFTT